jgi:hypothetical protein
MESNHIMFHVEHISTAHYLDILVDGLFHVEHVTLQAAIIKTSS